jgi:CheY-like chemotaxis protein
VPDFSNC